MPSAPRAGCSLRHHVVLHAVVLAAPAAGPALHDPGGIGGAAGRQSARLAAAAARRQHRASLLRALDERVGLPALAVTARTTRRPRDPYFLYSASNLGCLLALASYPTIVEPVFTLRDAVTRLWTIGYAAFVAARRRLRRHCLAAHRRRRHCSAPAGRLPRTVRRSRGAAARALDGARASSRRASCSRSRAMCRPTSRRSRSLWIVPLALYLLTFALAFGRHSAAVEAVGAARAPAARRAARALHDREAAGARSR